MSFDSFSTDQRRRVDDVRYANDRCELFNLSNMERHRRGHSSPPRPGVYRALENDHAKYTDVRLVRDKKNRKLNAFVDFVSIADARQFMRDCRGEIEIRKSLVRMIYSNSKEKRDDERVCRSSKYRLFQFEDPSSTIMLRGIPSSMDHHDVRDALDDARVNYVDVRVIKDKNTALVLRCLDALTTEDDICKVFEETADVKVRQCHVMRDEVMHVSRCFAFAELPSVADAYKVMDIVSKQYKLFEIGGKAVTISYAKNTFTLVPV
ncbi:RNA-binding protein 5 [Fasciolopsis buskii]|uniref:RNA-binding protein 5 n=1 Tax=Fasciolopsis buskii TaxID=27845 RepID=A0A8E0VKH9_9TREM|nr:RNA-binding protein 5 [Fasciolopsis buski]